MINTAAARTAGIRSLSHIQTLEYLRVRGPSPLARIGEHVGVSSAAMTGIADKFYFMGLAERVADPNDRRANLLRLTEKGAAIAASLAAPETSAA